jgi:lipoprotein-releasing system permease protein
MYKTLLCWRYLRTRYLAFACIISVMLGVATLIVVNSVMTGFSTKLRERLHALLSDVVIDSSDPVQGFDQPEAKVAQIRNDPFLGPRIEAMSATMEIFAMLEYEANNGRMVTRPVKIIGVDPETRLGIGGFQEHLVHHKDHAPVFEVPAKLRALIEEHQRMEYMLLQRDLLPPVNPNDPPPMPTPFRPKVPHGVVVGHLIATFRHTDPDTGETKELTTLPVGCAITLMTVSGYTPAGDHRPRPVYDQFVVTDHFKSEMSEYDGNYVFVELSYLQHLRAMPDRVTSIQVKVKDYDADAEEVVKRLRSMFARDSLRIDTWEDKQGPLLAAIRIEKGLLNILLFLIVAVAGFGILAIFSMIVSEKTRDIGILKALGASNGGVMQIFLGYGLLLGVVGALLGTGAGVWLTNNINWVENKLADLSGQHVFNPQIYYFREIPTDLQPSAVVLVNLGAIAVAVLFSILPAIRAARLQPVQALRYE